MTYWWNTLYDDNLADILLVRKSKSEVESTLRFLEDKLRLEPDAHVFDQCCGIGSLSFPLAESGRSVVGVDQAAGYIRRAQTSAESRGLEATFVAADAFTFVSPTPCDAAFNWWTSFGYAETDEANLQMLLRACDSLKQGGHFALDFMNLPQVLRAFQPQVVTRRSTADGELILIRETELRLTEGVMSKRWTYVLPDGQRTEAKSRVRLYMPHDIGRLLRRAGFSQVKFYGSVGGEALNADSPRCIAVAKKAGS